MLEIYQTIGYRVEIKFSNKHSLTTFLKKKKTVPNLIYTILVYFILIFEEIKDYLTWQLSHYIDFHMSSNIMCTNITAN